MKKIFVGNCHFHATEDSLRDFVESQNVMIQSVKIIIDRETGRSRGFAFVELDDSQDVDEAIENLNGKEFEGRNLTVNEAREMKPRSNFAPRSNDQGSSKFDRKSRDRNSRRRFD